LGGSIDLGISGALMYIREYRELRAFGHESRTYKVMTSIALGACSIASQHFQGVEENST
jgi:hypothetical protein